MTQLSEHFSLAELVRSDIAIRKGISNSPDAEQIENLKTLARELERIRLVLGHPMHIDSGFRSPKLNAAVGGSKNSYHMKGLAADFTCEAFGTPREICNKIMDEDLPFDQLILEGVTEEHPDGSWVHVGMNEANNTMRGDILTVSFKGPVRTAVQGIA